MYEKRLLGKNYIESTILYDATETILSVFKWEKEPKRYFNEFQFEVSATENKERPEREQPKQGQKSLPFSLSRGSLTKDQGYCIRTGKQIPFDLKRPMCYEAYQSWNQHKKFDFKEKYCHKTGNPSNGKTSMSKPILEF